MMTALETRELFGVLEETTTAHGSSETALELSRHRVGLHL
jgi:hypothetical protein